MSYIIRCHVEYIDCHYYSCGYAGMHDIHNVISGGLADIQLLSYPPTTCVVCGCHCHHARAGQQTLTALSRRYCINILIIH